MEAEFGRSRLPSNVSLHKDQSILILNQDPAPCAAARCDSLLPLLQKSLPFKCIHEQNASRSPDRLSSVPDLILLRPAADEAAQELVQSCKKKWACASILAILCAKWDRLFEDLPSVLTKVDDFLYCPFYESELLLRVRRLLQSKESKTTSSENPDTDQELHFGALVGKSESFVRAI